jgi:hypothetical protein
MSDFQDMDYGTDDNTDEGFQSSSSFVKKSPVKQEEEVQLTEEEIQKQQEEMIQRKLQ